MDVLSSVETFSRTPTKRQRLSRRAIAELYERVARVNRNALSLLQEVHDKLLTDELLTDVSRKNVSENSGNIAATKAFTRSAVRSIDYVNSLVQESLKFAARDLAAAAAAAAATREEKSDRVRTFLSRVFRKCVRSMSRLFVERVLRTRALARQRRFSAVRGKKFVDNSEALTNNATLSCPVCKRSFEKTFHYLQHIRVHYRLNLYVCERCRETFVQQNGLDYHRRQCCPAAAAAATVASSSSSVVKRDDDKVIFYRDSSRRCRSFRTTENRRVRAFELCESCDALREHGPVLRNHVLRAHATRNIDLGVNRTQQLDMENLLNAYDAAKR